MQRIKNFKAEAIRLYHSHTVTAIIVAFLGITAFFILLAAFLDARAGQIHVLIKIENQYAGWRASGCPMGLELKEYLKNFEQYEAATNPFIIDSENYHSFIVCSEKTGNPPQSLYLTTNGVIICKSENSAPSIVAVIKMEDDGKYSMTRK